MKKFTQEQIGQLRAQVEQIMENLSEDNTSRDICAQMYVNGLEDKTLAQGEAMADSIFESIAAFDRDYAHAKADLDAFTDSFLEEALKERSLAERCNYLMKLTAAISAARCMFDAEGGREQARSSVAEADAARIFEEEATEALELQLRAQLKNALQGCSIMVAALEMQRQELLEIESEDEAAALLVEAGTRNNDYRAILAMQAYINIKNGSFEDIPSDTTAAQAATMVCTFTEEVRILHQLKDQSITEETAHLLLMVLGTVAIARMTLPLINISMGLCSAMFGSILAIPAMLVVATTICRVAWKVSDAWMEDSAKIVRYTAIGVRALCAAAGCVLSFAAEHAKDALTRMARMAAKAVKRLLNLLRRGHRTEDALVDAQELEDAVGEDPDEEDLEAEAEYENE